MHLLQIPEAAEKTYSLIEEGGIIAVLVAIVVALSYGLYALGKQLGKATNAQLQATAAQTEVYKNLANEFKSENDRLVEKLSDHVARSISAHHDQTVVLREQTKVLYEIRDQNTRILERST